MKNHMVRIHLTVAAIVIVNTLCTLPQNVDPVEWKMHVEVPVVQQKIMIRDILNHEIMKGFPYTTTGDGDTMTCIREERIEYIFEQPLGITDSIEVRQTLGASTIQGIPPVDINLPVIFAMPLKYKAGSKLKESTHVSISQKACSIEGVAMVRFDENSAGLKITLTNNAPQCDMDDIVMALMDSSDAIVVVHVAHLDAGASETVTVPVAGKSLKSPVAIALSASLPEGAIVNMTDLFTIFFSFNGLTISEAYIEDSFIEQFSTIYAELPLSDSLKIEHLETDETILEFLVESSAQMKLRIRGSLNSGAESGRRESTHAVFSGDEKEKEYSSSGELFKVDTLVASLTAKKRRVNIPIRALILNPGWDNQNNRSTIGCTFTIGILGENKVIHFKKQDEIRLVLYPIHFPLKKCTGQCIKPLVQTETAEVNSGLLAEDKNIQKIQKTLVFNSARLKFDLDPGLPDGCTLDSILVKTVMRSGNSSSDSVELVMPLTKLTSGTHHYAEMEFGKLFNHWSDTFTFDVRLLLSPGTGFVIENNRMWSGRNGKTLRFSPKLVWKSLVPLCWKVNEKCVVELEKTAVNFTDDQLGILNTLKEPEVKVILKISNKSNITCTVAAIGAPHSHENELFAYPDTLVGRALFGADLPEHLFTFTGTSGVTLAPRNEISITEMTFDSSCINAFVHGQECIIRWFLMVVPGETDALLKDDYVQVDATAIVEGKNSTEMLTAMK